MEKSSENEHFQKAFGWAARDTSGFLSPFHFSRRATGEKDVTLKVLYCGICHSDVNYVTEEWGVHIFPAVPGHEIVGEVTEVGSKVQKFKVGDKVGVSGIIGSCGSCDDCSNDRESYCRDINPVFVGNDYDGIKNQGGFSDLLVVDEHFAVRIPDKMPLDSTAALLCSGITVYSSLKYFELDKPGLHVGVIGVDFKALIAVKFAKALGAKVTVIGSSPSKIDEDVNHLSYEPEDMQDAMRTMDGIIDSIAGAHPLLPLLDLLKSHGKLVMLADTEEPFELPISPLIWERKMIGGSHTGGMKEMQEMIDFAAEHDIKADIEVIPMDYVNTAMWRVRNERVKHHFVIDIGNTLKSRLKNPSNNDNDQEPPEKPGDLFEEPPSVETHKREEKKTQRLSTLSSVKSKEKMGPSGSIMKRKKRKLPSFDQHKQKRPKFRAPTRRTWLN